MGRIRLHIQSWTGEVVHLLWEDGPGLHVLRGMQLPSQTYCVSRLVLPLPVFTCRHKYEFLHSGTTPDIRITVPPKRIGILLDYDNWKLSFFNLDIAQHLYTFNSHFQHYVHPCFALERPGFMRIHNGIAAPTSIALS